MAFARLRAVKCTIRQMCVGCRQAATAATFNVHGLPVTVRVCDVARSAAAGVLQVAVIAEGGGDAAALLGLVRLSHWLLGAASTCGVGSSSSGGGAPGEQDARQLLPEGLGSSRRLVTDVGALPHPQSTPYRILVDSGTGTTAIGVCAGCCRAGLASSRGGPPPQARGALSPRH